MFTVNYKRVQHALAVASKTLPSKRSRSVWHTYVEFFAENGTIWLRTRSPDCVQRVDLGSASAQALADLADPIFVDYLALESGLKGSKGHDLTITVAGSVANRSATFAFGGATIELACQINPKITDMWSPSVINQRTITLPISVLDDLVEIERAICNDETRYHLHCALFDFRASDLVIVATNGHWLKNSEIKNLPHGADLDCSIPSAAITTMIALRSRNQDRATFAITCHASQWRVTIGHTTIEGKSVDAKYPPWREVCPTRGANVRSTIEIDPEDLRSALAPFPKSKTNGIKLELIGVMHDQKLRLTLDHYRDGSSEKSTILRDIALKNTPTGEPEPIGVNATYLREMLPAKHRCATITLELRGPLDPIAVYQGDLSVVIMPMRI